MCTHNNSPRGLIRYSVLRVASLPRCIPAVIACVGFLASCDTSLPKPTAAMSVRATCPPNESDQFFFAKGTVIPSSDEDDTHQRAAYSRVLRTVEANSLSCGESPDEAYRLVRLSLAGPGDVITVWRSGTRWRLDRAVLADSMKLRPVLVSRSVTTELSLEQVQQLAAALDKARFWTTMPVWTNRNTAVDGSVWVIDARSDGRYRVVSSALPLQNEFLDAARTFPSYVELTPAP